MRLGKWVFWLSLAMWFAETAYFGFNARPSCELERRLDMIFQFTGTVGLLLIFFEVVRFVEEHKKQPHVKITVNFDKPEDRYTIDERLH